MTALPASDTLTRPVVTRTLPAYCFVIMHENLARAGIEVQGDLQTFARRAFQAAFRHVDELTQHRALKIVNDEGQKLLEAPNLGDDQLPTLYAALAHAVCKAANRGVPFDKNILLLAMGVESDIAFSADEYGGMALIDACADKIDNAARSAGWWREPPVLLADPADIINVA